MKTHKRILLVGIFVFLGFWSSLVYGEDLLDGFSESMSSIQERLGPVTLVKVARILSY